MLTSEARHVDRDVGDGPGWRPPGQVGTARALLARSSTSWLVLAGVLLDVAVVVVAVAGLRETRAADEAVARVSQAQSGFQDADMLHDALYADVLSAVVAVEGLMAQATETPAEAAVRHAAAFRRDLAVVDGADLPAAARRAVLGVRPAQEAFVQRCLELTRSAPADRARLLAALPDLRLRYEELETDQAQVTSALDRLAESTSASSAERRQRAQRLILVTSGVGLAGVLALSVRLVRLARRAARALAEERAGATTLQAAMLPDELPSLPGVQIAAHYLPAQRSALVGGDWYDAFLLATGRLALVVGDVAGHDLSAAALMTQLRNALRAYAVEGGSPGEVLTRVNALCAQQGAATAATCLYAVVDLEEQTVTVANAGHHEPLLRAGDGACDYLEGPRRPPLATLPHVTYVDTVHHLPPGSLLVLFTDGLVESRRTPLDDGLEQLRHRVAGAQGEPRDVCGSVLASVPADGGEDDVALLVVQVAPQLDPDLELVVDARPASLRHLRLTLSRWLRQVGAGEDDAYDVLVAAGEAASNAVEHAYGPSSTTFTVRCARRGDAVEVVVADTGRWRAPRGAHRGRGLVLVRGLMDEVAVSTDDRGTRVRMLRQLRGPAEGR